MESMDTSINCTLTISHLYGKNSTGFFPYNIFRNKSRSFQDLTVKHKTLNFKR